METLGDLCRPGEGDAIRFCTTQSIDRCNIKDHGIDGFYKDGRYWSADMADHWTPGEITSWAHRQTVDSHAGRITLAILYEHEDGRYAVAIGEGSFTTGDPKWHRLGPCDVHGEADRG